MIFLNSKAQISIEVLVIIIFLTLFIYSYTTNAEKIVESVEITRVKSQQQDILLSVRDFISIQELIINDQNITAHNAKFKIPTIDLASKRVMCAINFDSDSISVSSADFGGIQTRINIKQNSKISFPAKKTCGQELICIFDINTKILNCS